VAIEYKGFGAFVGSLASLLNGGITHYLASKQSLGLACKKASILFKIIALYLYKSMLPYSFS
jgi:hypothetical protein